MNISLIPEFEQFVHEKVKSGRYLSASEVIRDALRLLEERDRIYQTRLAELQKEITIGIEAPERGEVFDSEEVFTELDEDIQQLSQARL